MGNFEQIKEALEYIDNHLDEPMSFESLAKHFHFSPYYFHRMFSVITGKAIAAHIRDRRLMRACTRLADTDGSILGIGLDYGYHSAQSFSRAFRNAYGLSPSDYRRQGFVPMTVTVDEMIMKFTNRLKGGVYVNPKIIKRDALTIAGISGDGGKTGEIWEAFMKLRGENPVANTLSGASYEIRLYDGGACTVHVGLSVSGAPAPGGPYTLYTLPASEYASFDVYVANGYDSENSAMDEWLKTNRQGYSERLLGDVHYCVEYYDERFHGSETGSIVEIWVPIEKKP
ncbi:MAG: AraC family transcriptional regulator [Oscillospiraceae bacterium]|nr:AraC family transcriptional regulator [Oscillospiraceae bacterium]